MPLGIIDEEDRDSLANDHGTDGAPAPAVKRIKDKEVKNDSAKISTLSGPENDFADNSIAHNVADLAHHRSPQRVLVATGIGSDKYVYELEAALLAEASIDSTSSFAAPVGNGSGVTEDGTAKGLRLMGKAEHRISKVAHALRDKVKKSVTFGPVDDVRFMTPSPYRSSIDVTSAVEVDAGQ